MNVKCEGRFKNFLKKHSDIIEFKPDTPPHAQAIRVKGVSGSNSIELPRKSTEIELLEQILNDADKIYIDTCALMETPIEKFFEKANPILKELKKKIIVILAVELELKKIAKPNDEKKYTPAQIKKAENVLASDVLYPTKNEIEISGSDIDDEGMADPIFMSIFGKCRRKHKMLLISRDYNLSYEILDMNKSKAVKGEDCMVCKIDNEGYLKYFETHNPKQS